MAKRDADGAPKKFSSKLLQMKFMQRAVAKSETAPAEKVRHHDGHEMHQGHDQSAMHAIQHFNLAQISCMRSRLFNVS